MEKTKYLQCERRHVYIILMFIGGYFGAYTYVFKGGVFCNAQTGNFLFMAISIGNKDFVKALYYLIPMLAFLLGVIVSEALPNPIKKLKILRWDTLLIAFEIIAVIVLTFIPNNFPNQITQISVNFIMAMQYNTFRQTRGMNMATTFCTNHIRQVGIALYKSLTKHNKNMHFFKFYSHAFMILSFISGAALSTLIGNLTSGKSIIFLVLPLIYLLIIFVRADLFLEKEYLSQKPSGH